MVFTWFPLILKRFLSVDLFIILLFCYFVILLFKFLLYYLIFLSYNSCFLLKQWSRVLSNCHGRCLPFTGVTVYPPSDAAARLSTYVDRDEDSFIAEMYSDYCLLLSCFCFCIHLSYVVYFCLFRAIK
jgi:hypothetical protein